VLVDLAARADPDVEVVFLDTGFHFGETLTTARRMKARYDLNLVTLRPGGGAETYDVDGTEACCAARKVAPLDRHLAGRAAWVTGLRRAESSTRAGAGTVEWDAGRRMVKINPIVAWSDDDVARYIAAHDIIVNPLRDKGFDSIGCAPCTLPAPAGMAGGPAATGWSAACTSWRGTGERRGVRLPIALEVGGRRCVVFGSGPMARARAAALADAGAAVDVIARPHQDGDLAGAFPGRGRHRRRRRDRPHLRRGAARGRAPQCRR